MRRWGGASGRRHGAQGGGCAAHLGPVALVKADHALKGCCPRSPPFAPSEQLREALWPRDKRIRGEDDADRQRDCAVDRHTRQRDGVLVQRR
eukprot:scaffold41939_cov23-Tisochrysis_lutea.AAC.8